MLNKFSHIELVIIITFNSYKITLFSSDMFDQPDQDMPHAINVTPAEQEAIERVCILFFYHRENLFV